jgi:hypothetical protein
MATLTSVSENTVDGRVDVDPDRGDDRWTLHNRLPLDDDQVAVIVLPNTRHLPHGRHRVEDRHLKLPRRPGLPPKAGCGPCGERRRR